MLIAAAFFCLALLGGSVTGLQTGSIGRTFGNGLAGLMVCKGEGSGPVDTVVLNHSLGENTSSTHGVLHHFWITGDHGPGMIDEVWISYFVDGEETPSI